MFVVISVIMQIILIINSKYVVIFGTFPSLFSILFKKFKKGLLRSLSSMQNIQTLRQSYFKIKHLSINLSILIHYVHVK